MSKDQKGFIVYGDTKLLADELTDEQLGKLFRGMLDYFYTGKAPKFTGVLKFTFIPIKQQMDRDKEKYDAKCEKNRAKIQKYWDKVKSGTTEYSSIPMYTNATNINTNTDRDTKTDTDINTNTDTDINTTTNTNTDIKAVRGGADDDDDDNIFSIWKRLTPEDVDAVYDEYPESGGDLIQTVHDDVRTKRKRVDAPVAYILGYAKRVGWDDNADHGGAS